MALIGAYTPFQPLPDSDVSPAERVCHFPSELLSPTCQTLQDFAMLQCTFKDLPQVAGCNFLYYHNISTKNKINK